LFKKDGWRHSLVFPTLVSNLSNLHREDLSA
jgi:hypothetical protein